MAGGDEMGLLWVLAAWLVSLTAVLVGVRQILRGRRPPDRLPRLPPARAQELDERYARGEISRAEYERLLRETDEL